MKILLVRHGETNWNVKRKMQGKTDIELNENGKNQAKAISNKIKDENIDVIICSTLKRASKTAQIINEEIGCEIIYDDRLVERGCGIYEGKHPEEFDKVEFWSYKRNVKIEGAECVRDFFDRVFKALDDIIDKYKGKKVLIVAHGGVSLPVNCYFNGIPDRDNILDMGGMHNCEIARYKIED